MRKRLLLLAGMLVMLVLSASLFSCDVNSMLGGGTTPSSQQENKKAMIHYDPGQGLLSDGEWNAEVEMGEVYYKHPTPTREGYLFTGWYLDKECTELVSNGKLYKDEETTLYAGWEKALKFTVTFVSSCETVIEDQTVPDGERVTEPQAPQRQGYTFDGWYCDGTKWDFNSKVVENDVTLEAMWTPISYKITFVADGDVVGWADFTLDSERIIEPKVPEKEGYAGKWQSYELGAENMTVNAEYEIIVYKLTFIADGVTVGEVEFTVESSDFDVPPVPTKDGYIGKWESYELSLRDIAVNAVYEPVIEKVEITFSPNRGTIVDGDFEIEINKGSKLSESKLPIVEREGYEFSYWSYDGTGETEWDPAERFTQDTTLYAIWQKVDSGGDGGTGDGTDTEKETVTVKFDTGVGYFENNKYTYQVEKNGFFEGSLPIPISDDPKYEFIGWYKDTEYTRLASPSDLYIADTELYSCWITVPQCADGSYDHTWSGWEETVAPTCTKKGVKARFCTICNAESTMTGSPATGHDYGPWDEGFLCRERRCKVSGCGYEQYQELENITLSTLGKIPRNQVSLQMYAGWGTDRLLCLIDGVWDHQNYQVFTGNACEVKVIIDLATPSTMDRIYVKGHGAGSGFYTYVQYEGDSDYTIVGTGSFLNHAQNEDVENRVIPYCEVDNTRKITKVQIVMPICSQGEDFWEEIAFVRVPPTADPVKKWHNIYYYNVDGATHSNRSEYTEEDSFILTEATKEGCFFDGWYSDKYYNNEVTEITAGTTGDIELYAKWIEKSKPDAEGNYVPETLRDWSGEKLRILATTWNNSADPSAPWSQVELTVRPEYFNTDTGFGTLINNAVITRENFIKAAYGVELEWVNARGTMIANILSDAMVSGSEATSYHIAMPRMLEAQAIVATNSIYDISKSKYINLDASYYNQAAREAYTINGVTLFAAGDFSFLDESTSYVLYYNQAIAEEIENFPDLYQMVREGKWTIDQMTNIAKLVKKNVGAPEWTDDDTYGFGTTSLAKFYQYSGIKQASVADGKYVLSLNDANVNTLVDKLVAINAADWARTKWDGAYGAAELAFREGRLLFYSEVMERADYFDIQDEEFKVGVLPMPKLNEAQQSYCAPCSYLSVLMCIPKATMDREMSEYFFEILSYTGQKYVMKAYKDNLRSKLNYETFAESMEIIEDYIFPNILYDVGYMDGWNGLLSDVQTESYSFGKNNFTESYGIAEKDATEVVDKWNKNWELYTE